MTHNTDDDDISEVERENTRDHAAKVHQRLRETVAVITASIPIIRGDEDDWLAKRPETGTR